MAIPENYIDKITKDGESRDICPAADKVRVGNENFDGTNLDDVLNEIAEEMDNAGDGTVTGVKVGDTTYEPTEGVVDLSTPFAGKVDKVPGKGLSTNDYTDADKTKLAGLPTAGQLTQQLGTKANDNAVIKSISVNGTAQTKDTNGNVNIEVQTGSTISPADTAPQMDGTANVGSSAKYAREDHVHPHDTSKANASEVYTKTQTDTLLAGKQSKLTFDDAPTTGSNNPVKSGGIYDAIAAMLSQVTVNAIPAGSVAVEDNLASTSQTNALSANMGAELYALIQILFQQLNMIEVSEDGLYFIDSNDNIGVCIDSDGLHAINILEHVITG